MSSNDLILVPAEAHKCLQWLAGALQAVADEGDLITMDGAQRTIGSILDDADKILGLIATQPAAGEPVAVIDVNAIADYVADHWPMKKHSLEEIESGLRSIALEVAPPAAAHGDEAVRKDAERWRWLLREGVKNCEEFRGIPFEGEAQMTAILDAAMRAQAGEGGE